MIFPWRSWLVRLLLVILCLSPAAADPTNVVLWQLPNREAKTVEERADLAVLRRFLELNPDIRLDGFRGVTAPGLSQDSQSLLAMAGGVAPDVMYVNFRQSDSYISQGFLQPLDEYVKKWAGVTDLKDAPEKLKHLILPQIWPVIMRPGPDGKEHVWAIPYGGALAMTLVYRKDHFRKAGLDPDRPPKTWDELYEYAKKLTDPSRGQYGFGLAAGPSASWHFVDLLWSAGGEVVRQDSEGNWLAAWNDDAAVTALRYYQKLCRSKTTYRQTDLTQRFQLGKVGMMFTYINEQMMSTVNPNLVGIAPLPLGPSGKRGNELNSRMQGLNSSIKDPAVRDAAWKWILFRAGDEALRVKTQVYVEAGYGRFLNPIYLRRFLSPSEYERYRRDVPAGWNEALTEALKSGRPEPYGKNCQLIYIQMTPPLDQVTLTDQSDDAFLRGILDRSVRETNEKLLGRVSDSEKSRRRNVALVVVLALAAGFGLVFRLVLKTFSGNLSGPTMSGKGWRRARFAYLIMAPALISVALWQYYPLVRGSLMAFQDYRLILPSRWVGLDNFAEVLFTPLFWQAIGNSVRYMGLSLGLGFIAPIILALLLHEIPKGKTLFRTLYYLPAVTTGLVIMFLWKQFYEPGPNGLLNQALLHAAASFRSVGVPCKFEPLDWLGDPKLAMISIIIPQIWAGMGPGCIIYLAALKSVPEDVYEAADLDGAGILSKVWNITLPYLKPLVIINFVGAFIGAARAFDFIFVMTGGGPVFSTHVAGLEIWFTAFMYLKFGYAVSMAWIVGAFLVGFTLLQLRILSRVQFKTAQA